MPVWKLVLVAFSAVAIVTVVAVLIKQFTQPGHLDASTAAPGTGQQQLGYAVLPPPGSQEAQKLLASNDTPGASLHNHEVGLCSMFPLQRFAVP